MEANQTVFAANPAGLQQCRRSKEIDSKKGEWSDGATTSLLDAYETKWNKRNRGNLRVGDWEEVSISVSSRCNGTKPGKTSTQCKNKVEGMKKRYRLETMEASIYGGSSWPFFARMDSLLRSTNKSLMDAVPSGLDPGDLGLGLGFSELVHQSHGDQAVLQGDDNGATALLCHDDDRHMPFSHLQLLQGNGDLGGRAFFPEEEEEDEEEEEGLQEAESKHEVSSRALMQRKENSETSAHGCKPAVDVAAMGPGAMNTVPITKRKPSTKQKKHVHNEVVASIKTFAESILKLEHAKMEMYKDAERLRAEAEARRADLELRRTQMIMNTQLEIAKLLAGDSSAIKTIVKKKKKKKKVANVACTNGMPLTNADPGEITVQQVQHVESIHLPRSASANEF